jgi:hypothetical protein
VIAMDSETLSTHRQDDALVDAGGTMPTSQRFAYWRWLLFAAMARLELRDDSYLRIPNDRTKRHIVVVKIP